MYSNTLYYIYFKCVINTDGKQKEMQTGCEQSTKSLKDDPLNSSYFTSQMNILLSNKRKYCVYTFFLIPGSGWEFRRRSNCFRSILSMLCISDQYLLTLVAPIPRWNQNFRRTAGLTFSAFHDDGSIEQIKRFCADFSRSDANRIQVMSNFRIPARPHQGA